MFSVVSPGFVYTDVSRDIVEHDIDVVSDLWTFDDREVYRGSRDKKYTHANVYWLYSEELERVGCVEHDPVNHSKFQTLWFHENPFATLMQEEEWESHDTIWATLPQRSAELFLANGWTTPTLFLEHCLQGPTRVISPSMLMKMPEVFECVKCSKKSLTQFDHGTARPLDFPSKEKILFLDDDMIVCVPPSSSRVWSLITQLQPLGADSLPQEQVQEQERQTAPSPPPPSPQPSPTPEQQAPSQ